MSVSLLSLHLGRQRAVALMLASLLALPLAEAAEKLDSSFGVYAGQYYDSDPASFSQGRANYLNQYLVALTGSKTVWRASSWPVS